MAIEHDEHYYLCSDCEGEGMADIQVSEAGDTEWGWCSGCGDGMSKGTGYIEGDADDCETSLCDVATGALTL